jgi:hypothetical protein
VNAYLLVRGAGVYAETVAWFGRIPPGFWMAVLIGIGKALALVVLATVAIRLIRRLLLRGQERLKRAGRLKANDESIEVLFGGLNRIQTNAIWLIVLAFTARWLQVPRRSSATCSWRCAST